jgi:predicted ATPase/DNA-binding SARP family transcriptional activator
MDDTLVIYLLGQVRLRWGSVALLDRLGHKEIALLIYLACTKRPQPRETLADLFWGARPKAQGQANLRTLLARLRRALPGHVIIDRDTITFNTDRPHWLDAPEFQAQMSAADASAPLPNGRLSRVAADTLGRALRLYRGDFLAGFHVHDANGFEDWAAGERERLRRIALAGLTRLVDFCLERGQYAEGIEHTTRLLALDLLDEAAHRRMMHLLALSDQRHIALAQYEICRRALAEELDVEPDSETKALYQRIRGGQYDRGAPHVEAIEPPPSAQHGRPKLHNYANLPTPLTPFIGREAELAKLRGWLLNSDCRLITIAGAGGFGKTRLALGAAKQVWAEFADGVDYVALAEVASGDQQPARMALAGAIADTLGLTPHSPDITVDLCANLRQAELLLLLDGIEHLIGGADLLVELLRCAPNVRILATSRQPLNLQSEHLIWLRGLPVPASAHDPNASAYSGIQLFAERVERLGVELNVADQMPNILHICRLASGLPLAIELAALLASRLWLPEIARAIERNPDVLAASVSDLPTRHRSLRALFESSWRLLSQDEQHVLAQCSTFAGSFTLAEALAATSIEQARLRSALAALANYSLLHLSGSGRYELDRLLLPFAAEKLAI